MQPDTFNHLTNVFVIARAFSIEIKAAAMARERWIGHCFHDDFALKWFDFMIKELNLQ